eukprot:TRINITY_DN10539_c0_g3_i1.p1 TRINITY_DN10539_c0_g3~~TRINITY_DN10539_c0_g3_i1.p1  ORF type:complete len:555 (+),score=63.40 TRINITY_DN10539_c0_g3_i1:108-1667(+)
MHVAAVLKTVAPSAEEMAVHLECVTRLKEMVKALGPGWLISPFGSAANGFLMRGGDLDVTCYHALVPKQDSHLAIAELKHSFLPLLNHQREFDVKQTIWGARVPILKLRYRNTIDRPGIDVDLSCHNLQALQNSHLLRSYADLSPVIRGLGLCVKFWSKQEGVNGAPGGFLSSYSLTLMLLYFLQVDPDLAMPCLPTHCFSSDGPTPEISSVTWTCSLSLPVVLRKFFTFYGSERGTGFQWGSEVVSVRLGWRSMASDEHFAGLPGRTAKRLHVEDPFLPRNLNCVLSAQNEHTTKIKFQEAAGRLFSSQVPTAFLQFANQAGVRTLHTNTGTLPHFQSPFIQQGYQPSWSVNTSISHTDLSAPASSMLGRHSSTQSAAMTSNASCIGQIGKQPHKSSETRIRHMNALSLTSINVQKMRGRISSSKASGSIASASDCESTQSGGATSATASTPAGSSRSASLEHTPALFVEAVKQRSEANSKATKKYGRNKIPQSIDENTIEAVGPAPCDIPVPKLMHS